MNDLEWESSVPRAQGQVDHLCVRPQPPDPVPPPSPVVVCGKTRA